MKRRPIRVLYVTSTARIGGAERRALNLIQYADRSRCEASLLALETEGSLREEAEARGIEGEYWRGHALPSPGRLRAMRRKLAAGEFDVVVPFGLRAEVLSRGPASRAECLVVSMICSVDPWRHWYHTALDRATAGGVCAWISNSEAGKRAAVERGGIDPKRVFVVPTGIPDRLMASELVRREARRRFGVGEAEGPVLAVLANLREAKGYGDLIQAMAKLKSDWPGLVCLCAGRDDSRGAMAKRARTAGAGEAMRFLGFQSDGAAVYEAADLAVLSSHWEGMPSALVEALRAGLASVATDVGGVSEVVRPGQEGLLTPSGDPRALAEAIDRALRHPDERAAWARSARRRYEQEFRIERMVGRTLDILEAVVADRARGAGDWPRD